ncbi:unnamed protein product [Prunus armeniaca]|uniref:D-isomer specific 2-hydroxyacid dehydrogenase NAD-binding domain-containing protein n=1 Tax=Prunus armeniaca TaxID=36596 RepID=A0A6J5Y7W1_PRUAR|nr:unnamed protein product [Prunus armeniaca]
MDKCRPAIDSAVFLGVSKGISLGKTVGIIGLGRIGKARVEVLGMLSKFHGGILVNIGRGLNVDEPESLHCWMVSAEMAMVMKGLLNLVNTEGTQVVEKQCWFVVQGWWMGDISIKVFWPLLCYLCKWQTCWNSSTTKPPNPRAISTILFFFHENDQQGCC